MSGLLAVWVLASLALSPSALADVPLTEPPMCDPVSDAMLDEATHDMGRELACPICAGQSVSGSQTPVALGMKAIIRESLSLGYCSEQISDYFVLVYGDDVVLDPSKRGNSALVWLPLLGVLVGFVGAGFWWVRQPKTLVETPSVPPEGANVSADPEDPYQAQVLRELDE
ncbi:MAG: cytochrome c-type biogenesis protein CcmH/NrfF [Cognaticolwellia sp.]|jgi:cytochrome c-type biogenesis protein CcmH/NrfF